MTAYQRQLAAALAMMIPIAGFGSLVIVSALGDEPPTPPGTTLLFAIFVTMCLGSLVCTVLGIRRWHWGGLLGSGIIIGYFVSLGLQTLTTARYEIGTLVRDGMLFCGYVAILGVYMYRNYPAVIDEQRTQTTAGK